MRVGVVAWVLLHSACSTAVPLYVIQWSHDAISADRRSPAYKAQSRFFLLKCQ